ncbi:YeeE/YedE family protein [uncultured Erythrobacter sp.]|uniref:YeeE/YedE family protein n=1 Tax=uncultured Erythrobacter sp. TaxID=263913 RepID=UPI002629B23D|nr:YeeE/YedE family protein [uncultured Erythrobacter sp.]
MPQIPKIVPLTLVLAGLVGLLISVWSASGLTLTLATCIGLFAGFALYHAAFGFTAHWRNFLSAGRGGGLRMQLVLIGLVSLISFPLIAYGEGFGVSARGSVAPVSIGVFAGAFTFGFGMMFAGGCGSGTLFTVGGGSTRMVVTLSAFVAGSIFATLHVPWWRALPSGPRVGLIEEAGALGGLFILFAILGVIAVLSIKREKALFGKIEPTRETGSLLTGPWSLLAGALALGMVSIATLALLGRPWGITSAFTLWGAKIGTAAGLDIANWPFWQTRQGWLERNVLSDPTSVMNFGVIGGAMLAANLAGRFAPTLRLSWSDVGTAVLGGLLMGYGARIAYGCNIGGFLGGMISGSLHGLVWMLAALAGSALALKIRTGRGFVMVEK